jgi:transcription antitermination factor NusG
MLQPVNHLHDTEPRWFAIRTRSKSEKAVSRTLAKKGVQTYLPLQKLVRHYVRSKRTVEKPLINCYVFVQITRAQYLSVLETEHVTGFVRFNKDLPAIPEEEIHLLRRITLEDGLEIEAVAGSFSTGEMVEISAGNLIGMKGRVIKTEGKRKFQVELLTLGYSLLISVDAAFLGKVGRDW